MKIIKSMKDLNFSQLTDVYAQSISDDGNVRYAMLPQTERIIQAEQDFYAYLRLFFKEKGAFGAVWSAEGRYVSALRIEPYKDGFLVAGLETAQQYRGKGYAGLLLHSVVTYLSDYAKQPIYSHIDKRNVASLRVHQKCGFDRIMEHAVYSDGSVLQSSCTMCYKK